MPDNAALITKFYTHFQARDGRAMAACYAHDVVFSDNAFPRLEGFRAGAMWQMLCERGRDLELTFEDVHADDARGKARWTARYTFSKTKRKVVNVIDAAFEFRDGAIVRHADSFDFWTWSRQSLGPVGLILGWSPWLKAKVQAEAAKGLDAFIRERKLAPA